MGDKICTYLPNLKVLRVLYEASNWKLRKQSQTLLQPLLTKNISTYVLSTRTYKLQCRVEYYAKVSDH